MLLPFLGLLIAPTVIAIRQTPPALPERLSSERVELGWENLERQQHDNTCGLAVIANLLWQTGQSTSEAELSRETQLTKQGISLYDFAQLAKKHRIYGIWVEAALSSVQELKTPFVAQVKDPNGHFVIVQRIYNNHILVADPNAGNLLYSQEAFGRIWTRRAFVSDLPK